MQSRELVAVVDTIRKQRDLGVVAYTGRTIESLVDSGDPDILAFLDRVDLLIDGPYVRSQHADLLWRASRNQRLIPLTNRYRSLVENLTPATDRSAGIEFTYSDGVVYYVGIPSDPDFHENMAREMNLMRYIERYRIS
jgi:anaerobic ribonucleoside-triphosphate reductase activating protein